MTSETDPLVDLSDDTLEMLRNMTCGYLEADLRAVSVHGREPEAHESVAQRAASDVLDILCTPRYRRRPIIDAWASRYAPASKEDGA